MNCFDQCYVSSDIDECDTEEHSCSVDAVCNNTEGSYSCVCKPGFSGDGWACRGNAMKHRRLNIGLERLLFCNSSVHSLQER